MDYHRVGVCLDIRAHFPGFNGDSGSKCHPGELKAGKSQPVSLLRERAGKRAIMRSEAPWQFWYHLAPWLCLAPICAALCVFLTIAATTYPACSDLVREQCVVR